MQPILFLHLPIRSAQFAHNIFVRRLAAILLLFCITTIACIAHAEDRKALRLYSAPGSGAQDYEDFAPFASELGTRCIEKEIYVKAKSCTFEYLYEYYVYPYSWRVAMKQTKVSENLTTNVDDVFITETSASVGYLCPDGFHQPDALNNVNPYRCSREDFPKPDCELKCKAGNPVDIATGAKEQSEIDYENASGTLKFVRTYSSDLGGWSHNYSTSALTTASTERYAPDACFTYYWSGLERLHCHSAMRPKESNLMIVRGGVSITFGPDDLPTTKNVNDRAVRVTDPSGRQVGWRVTNTSDDTIEEFDMAGFMIKSTTRVGQQTRFTYSTEQTPAEIAQGAGQLIKVTDPFGKELKFTYQNGRIRTMTDPSGKLYEYTHNSDGMLDSITYPDGAKRTYLYGEPEMLTGGKRPTHLTGILDENNVRFATYKYDQYGKSASTEHAGETNKFTIYKDPSAYGTQFSMVTSPMGAGHGYTFKPINGVAKLWKIVKPSVQGSGTVESTREYDSNGNLVSSVDFDGKRTNFTFEPIRNLQISRTEGVWTPSERTISTVWHASLRLPTGIAEPKRRTTIAYYPNGEIKTRTVQATTDASGIAGFAAIVTGNARTWTYEYNPQWKLAKVIGPVASDITTYVYDSVTGDLQTITNAAGHVTRFTEYDGNGRAGLVTQANGVRTRMKYGPRGWLDSVTESDGGIDITSRYSYDRVGQLKTVTAPDGATITYTYDDAHRMTGVADAKGNKIHYVLDNMGNRTSEQVLDPQGVLKTQMTRQYNVLNRLELQTGGAQ